MPTRIAMQDGKVAVYEVPTLSSEDDAPLTDPDNNLSRLSFHSDREYIEIRDRRSFTISLPERAPNTAVKVDHVLFAHGMAAAPMVFGRIKNLYFNQSGPHVVPIAGTTIVPIDTQNGYHADNNLLQRWVSLMTDDTNVYLREYGFVLHDDFAYYSIKQQADLYPSSPGVGSQIKKWSAKSLEIDVYVSNFLVNGPASGYDATMPLGDYENNVLRFGRGKFSSEWMRLFKDATATDYAVVAGRNLEFGTQYSPNGNGTQFLTLSGIHFQIDGFTARIAPGSLNETPTFTATIQKAGIY